MKSLKKETDFLLWKDWDERGVKYGQLDGEKSCLDGRLRGLWFMDHTKPGGQWEVGNSGCLLGLVLCNFFTDDLKENRECSFSKLSDDTKLMGPVDKVQGWVTTKGFQVWWGNKLTGTPWNPTMRNVLHIGRKNHLQWYRLGTDNLGSSSVVSVLCHRSAVSSSSNNCQELPGLYEQEQSQQTKRRDYLPLHST